MSTDCLRPVAILWDIENCAVPHGVNAEYVAVHIRMALKVQLAVKGPISVFSAYGDFSNLPGRTRQGCQTTGVNLIDIPHGKKDAADKAILVDMFLFALDNPPPCTIVLISGDVDFAPALHKLGQRGYCVVLAIPSGLKVSPALRNACQYLWSWPDIARGKGLTNAEAPLTFSIKDDRPLKIVGLDAKNDCIDQATGNGHANCDTIDGDEDIYHGFANLGGRRSHNPNGYEALTTIPVGMFEERIKVPFDFAKESTEIPAATGMDFKGNGAFDRNGSLFPPSCGMAYPMTSDGMTSYDNVPCLTSQFLSGGVASSKSVPPGGQYVCDWFATPYPGRHRDVGTAQIGPSFNMGSELPNRSADYAMPAAREWDIHRPFSSPDRAYPNVKGPITRSQNAQKGSAKSKRPTSGSKQAAHANGQGPSSQLMVKKKKMKKTQDKCVVQAAPVASQKLSKKQRKAARLAALQAEGMV